MKSSFTTYPAFLDKYLKGHLYKRNDDNLIVLCTQNGKKLEGVIVNHINNKDIGTYSTNFPGDFLKFLGIVQLEED